MKETLAVWSPEQWAVVIGAFFTGLGSLIFAWRTGQKLENHDARSTARARERGDTANPSVKAEDRGHL
jgi:hypothetical protein